jgi:hypothetical protein
MRRSEVAQVLLWEDYRVTIDVENNILIVCTITHVS